MNIVLLSILCAVISYLSGGMNTAILLSKTLFHEDIRQKGSGNPGFTNFKRAYGMKYAWIVFVGDILKTLLPILVFSLLFSHLYGQRQLGAALAGFCAMLGHSYPIWYGFKGGKSFVCMIATVFFVDWRVGLIFAFVFTLLLFTVKYMSLSSMVSSFSAPVALAILGFDHVLALVFLSLGAALLIFRHHANVDRLLHGKEPKFSFFKKD